MVARNEGYKHRKVAHYDEKTVLMFQIVANLYTPYIETINSQVDSFSKSHSNWDLSYDSGLEPSDPDHHTLPTLQGNFKGEVEITSDQVGELATLAATISEILSVVTPTRAVWKTRSMSGSLGRGYNRTQVYQFTPKDLRSFRPK